MAERKPKRKSKVLWFNTALGVIFGGLEAAAPLLQVLVPSKAYLGLLAVSIVGNFILRFYTRDPVK